MGRVRQVREAAPSAGRRARTSVAGAGTYASAEAGRVTSLHATLRDALAQGYRSGTGWGGHPDGLDGATAAVVAWLAEDAQAETAKQAIEAADELAASETGGAVVCASAEDQARAALSALTETSGR
jgi:hypothetical protein